MLIKLTKSQVIDLYNGLHAVGHLEGVKFAYAIARNKTVIEPEIKALQEAEKIGEDFKVFEEERVALAKKYSKKDAKGEPQTYTEDGFARFLIDDQTKFDEELKQLKEKHKVAVEKREKQLKDLEDLLKETIELNLFTVPINYVPENIKSKEMMQILTIVDEEKDK